MSRSELVENSQRSAPRGWSTRAMEDFALGTRPLWQFLPLVATNWPVVTISEAALRFSVAFRQHETALGTVFSSRLPMDDDDESDGLSEVHGVRHWSQDHALGREFALTKDTSGGVALTLCRH